MFKALRTRWQSLLNRWRPTPPLQDTGAELLPSRLAHQYQALAAELPSPLVSAFAVHPLAYHDPRYVGRETTVAALEHAVEEWRAGCGKLSVVVGPPGSGLTSTLNQVLELDDAVCYFSLAQRPVSTANIMRLVQLLFGLPQAPTSTAAAIDALLLQPPRILLLDDGHLLLARKMGNGAALQTLAAVLLATQQHHCWILACTHHAWRRLCFLYDCERLFGRVLHIEYFDAAELAQAIEARLYGLGYQWKARLSLAEGERDPLAPHFKLLHEHSDGHPQLGFFLFLLALDVDEVQQCLALTDIPHLDTRCLKACSDDELFSLAELYAHGGLDRVEHETLFRLAPDQSLVRLEQLHLQGLVECRAGYYRLAPLVAPATVEFLINANRLY